MKLTLNLSLFLSAISLFGYQSYALTDSQIKRICKNEKGLSICIKSLKEKRSKLQKGNSIEIPVIPHKR